MIAVNLVNWIILLIKLVLILKTDSTKSITKRMIPTQIKVGWEITLLLLHMVVFRPIINPKLLRKMWKIKVLNKNGTRVLVLNQSKLKSLNQKEEERNRIKNTKILKFLSKKWILNKHTAHLSKVPNVNLNQQLKILQHLNLKT